MKYQLIMLLSLLIGLSSCVTHEELLNFSQGPAFPESAEDITNLPELRIQADDLLSIRIKALDPLAAEPFNLDPINLPLGNIQASGSIRPLIGYLVRRDGKIDMPIIGKIEAAGLTTDELQDSILTKLHPYLKEPAVVVRYLNFRITVLGEVTTPGTFLVANERVTILDLLGLAGDITPYGNRSNILVIREQNGQRTTGRLNLQDRDIFKSPFFYMQQNDVIYVEPLKTRTASIRDQSQRILPWLSAITALTTLALTLTNL